MAQYLIGLDEGTSGCKACVFDKSGNLIARDFQEYGCIYYPDMPGIVEQNAEDITPALYRAVKNAVEKSGVKKEDIVALGLSSQGAVIGLCDSDGSMMGNWIGWQDLRGFQVADKMPSILSDAEMVEETNFPSNGFSALSKHLWLKTFAPEAYDNAAHVTTMQEYYLRQFGAKDWVVDASSVCRESIVNLEQHSYSKKIFDAYGLDMSKRGRIVSNGYVAAEVSPEISEKTGLPVGCKICVGALDQGCSTFGCGMVDPGDTVIVMGTLGSCYVCADKLVRGGTLTWKTNHYFEGGLKNYTAEALSFASAATYKWFRDTVCTKEFTDAEREGKDAYEVINELIAASEPGAHGVTFTPYLQGRSYGYPESPMDIGATGAFTGMRLSTSRSDLARAVAEGIIFEMRDILGVVHGNGLVTKNIRVTGGVTKSELWCQMLADILGTSVTTLETSENGCLGAAMYAGIGAGIYKDAHDAVSAAVRTKKTYMPNLELKSVYDNAFALFVKRYQTLEKAE